jgi:hypothetical protein
MQMQCDAEGTRPLVTGNKPNMVASRVQVKLMTDMLPLNGQDQHACMENMPNCAVSSADLALPTSTLGNAVYRW